MFPQEDRGIRKIRICFLPGRESSYARTRILIKAMQKVGLDVLDCSCKNKSFLRYFSAFIKFLQNKSKADIIFVSFYGHFLVPLVKLLTKKKILFDAFVSTYQTLAIDRKVIGKNGPLAYIAKSLDRVACRMADRVFLDTYQHINFYVNTYGLDRQKFTRLLPGSDTTVMFPRDGESQDEFIVHFHSEFQPLHGAIYIVKAAKLLEHIKFRLIGRGMELKRCKRLSQKLKLKNIEFHPAVKYEDLPKYMAEANVCLGIFGDTAKTSTVIPHKVYEALAMGKPVITADTPAVRELLTHEKDVLFCENANPESLAKAIERLKNDKSLKETLGKKGHELCQKYCSFSKLGKIILGDIEKISI